MADEFIKGLGIFTGGGLAWLVLAGWYRTSSFESTHQLIEPVQQEGPDLFNAIGIALMDLFFWFTLIGTFTFWVLIPAFRQGREAVENRRAQ